MTKLKILGAATLALMMLAPDALAQRRGGGAVGGGVRGAMVGGMVGGSSGAKTGAKVGVAAGATRGVAQRADQRAMNQEAQARAQYQTTAEYQSAQHSDFSAAPPEVMVAASAPGSTTQGGEAIIRKNGKPVVGITYPSDWRQKVGDRYVSAVSSDGQAWSAIATLEGVQDKQAGIEKVKQGLEKYLQNIAYDDLTQTEGGALVVTGTGQGKKKGIDVVFAAGVFDSGPGQLAGAAFVVDASVEDHYKETVRYICQTIRGEQDFAQ